MDAAVLLFWEKGYAGTSIQDIADAVGILKGSLYHYVRSKEDLLFRIFDRSHHEAASIVASVQQLDAPPLVRLHRYVELYVRYCLENIERVSVYHRELRYLGGERWSAILAQRRVYERFVEGLLLEAQASGSLAAGIDARYAMYWVFGAINGLTDWYRRGGPATPDVIAVHYADMACATVGV
jgi:AcrR family transcriptional regulator